jgi:hypothetical protein
MPPTAPILPAVVHRSNPNCGRIPADLRREGVDPSSDVDEAFAYGIERLTRALPFESSGRSVSIEQDSS